MKKEYMKKRFYQKNIAWMYILVLVLGTVVSLILPKTEVAQATDPFVIPDEAIRLRILANSNKEKDQAIKREIRDSVNEEINQWVAELTSLEEARKVMISRLDKIEEIANQKLKEAGVNDSVHVEFGEAQFPTKLYGQYLYPAGTYEAIVITIGEGKGANWWCVLFPPLCFLDFSNSLAVSEETEDVEQDKRESSIEDKDNEKEKKEESKEDPDKEKIDAEKSVDEVEAVDSEPETTVGVKQEDEVEVKFFLVELWNKIF
ncbi:stage II sporulation protein R [Lederbergia sp. NSJ-179]|uniref:stage II sporulation protein R n=1 Tax=Lederbergia sp. NSJ-179 TaxID=2931402 RepID=UPI001FD24E68|nr:stage II sporulation protein R [Lederbergia sp. NSJ-179]MCJ7840561.1 stage II sporulation protein R [Lederbergia sp. NSJ-179]